MINNHHNQRPGDVVCGHWGAVHIHSHLAELSKLFWNWNMFSVISSFWQQQQKWGKRVICWFSLSRWCHHCAMHFQLDKNNVKGNVLAADTRQTVASTIVIIIIVHQLTSDFIVIYKSRKWGTWICHFSMEYFTLSFINSAWYGLEDESTRTMIQ